MSTTGGERHSADAPKFRTADIDAADTSVHQMFNKPAEIVAFRYFTQGPGRCIRTIGWRGVRSIASRR
jgi:hypothetical protein